MVIEIVVDRVLGGVRPELEGIAALCEDEHTRGRLQVDQCVDAAGGRMFARIQHGGRSGRSP
ncbi:hypothetical protein ACWGSK_23740 [Nocardiopsis sp. NPDC055551]|uniref:hypothetical protein n=1 Tax=Nocardiopsis sp. NPDC006832 TaxID=3157188 RepID=UPI0033E00681